jgi:hypothetical protein
LRPPDAKEVAAVAARVAEHVAALLENRDRASEPEEPAMADLYGASITGRLATGPNAGQKVKTFGEFRDESFERQGSRCAMVSGFSVHAGVGIRAADRKGLECLLSGGAAASRNGPPGAVAGWSIDLPIENTVEKWNHACYL